MKSIKHKIKIPLGLMLIALFSVTINITHAQHGLMTIVPGDTAVLSVSGAHGIIQWQKSSDSLNWQSMPGFSDSIITLAFAMADTGAMYYRTKVTNANHPSRFFYSSIIRVNVVSQSSELIPGSAFHGGIVYGTDGIGNGLIAAPMDQGTYPYGCYGTLITNAVSTTNGMANSSAILTVCSERPIAASVCDELTLNGYSDWYLPAKDQLNSLYLNQNLVGGFKYDDCYWSSTEGNNPNGAWREYFIDGNLNWAYGQNNPAYVRCVRSFSASDASSTVVVPSATVNISERPVITYFTPLSGPVGITVYIHGYGFNQSPTGNFVFLGSVRAAVTAACDTMIAVTVPAGTTYQPISVTDTAIGLSAYSMLPYTTTFGCGGVINGNTFATKTDLSGAGYGLRNLCLGDLDGDGKTDMVVNDDYNQSIVVNRNISIPGIVAFEPGVIVAVSGVPSQMVACDVDGDGKPDLILLDYYNNKIMIMLNTCTPGTISFAPALSLNTGYTTWGFTINDLDLDGKPDISYTTTNAKTFSVFLNTSVPGNISFVSTPAIYTGQYTEYIFSGDFDADGRPDLLITHSSFDSISVYRNTSTPGNISFAIKSRFEVGPNANFQAIGDLDRDGLNDIAFSRNDGSGVFGILRNTSVPGAISFAAKFTDTINDRTNKMVLSDVDGDCIPDFIINNLNTTAQPGSFSVIKNMSSLGHTAFAPNVKFNTASGIDKLETADIDGDGKPDVVTIMYEANFISIFRNQAGTLPVSTNADSVTICSGSSPAITLSSNNPTTYKWLATDNPNTTGESTGIQNTGYIIDYITNNTDTLQTVVYTVKPDPISSVCEGVAKMIYVQVNPSPHALAGSDHIICTGDSAQLGNTAVNGYTYLWSPATGLNLNTVPNPLASPESSTTYSVVVTDANNCTAVDQAVITVNRPISISMQPQYKNICKGGNVVLYLNASGTQPLTYQWKKDGVDISGAASNSFSISNSDFSDEGTYTCIVTDYCGTLSSDSADLKVISITADAGLYDPICEGLSTNFGVMAASNHPVESGTFSYLWTPVTGLSSATNVQPVAAPGQTTQYTVKVTDHQGCSASDHTMLLVSSTYQDEIICLVTVDSLTGRNSVLWEKTGDVGTASFNIYREVAAGTYNRVGNVLFNNQAVFTDTTSIPETHAYKYKIAVVDTCTKESAKSPYHKTISLILSAYNNTVGLSWNAYEDESNAFVPANYYIFRGTQPDNMYLLDSVSSSFTNYNDNNVTANYYYKIGVKKQDGCAISKSSAYTAFSNMRKNFNTAVGENSAAANFRISPNPFNESTTIEFGNPANSEYLLTVKNVAGAVVLNETVKGTAYCLKRKSFESGVYFVELKGPETFHGKLIIE